MNDLLMIYFWKSCGDWVLDEHDWFNVPGALEDEYAKRAPTSFETIFDYHLKLILDNCVPDMNVPELKFTDCRKFKEFLDKIYSTHYFWQNENSNKKNKFGEQANKFIRDTNNKEN